MSHGIEKLAEIRQHPNYAYYCQTSPDMTHGVWSATIKSGHNYRQCWIINKHFTYPLVMYHRKHHQPPLWRSTDSGLQSWQKLQGCVCVSWAIRKWTDKKEVQRERGTRRIHGRLEEVRRTVKEKEKEGEVGLCVCWALVATGVFTSGRSDFEGC